MTDHGHGERLSAATCTKRAAAPADPGRVEYVLACPHGETAAQLLRGDVDEALLWATLAARHGAERGCDCARLVLRVHGRRGRN